MKQLHWLPVNQRIIYKVALIAYKALNGLAPNCIRNMLNYSISSVNLRSSSKGLLIVPRVRLVNCCERSFSYAAPKLWNEITEYTRKSETLSTLRPRIICRSIFWQCNMQFQTEVNEISLVVSPHLYQRIFQILG